MGRSYGPPKYPGESFRAKHGARRRISIPLTAIDVLFGFLGAALLEKRPARFWGC